MMSVKLSYRNILRNRRRSAMTALAVAAGTQALLLFGGFQSYVFAGLESGAVQRSGHLTVYREGYFLYGAGNPVDYGIDRYPELIRLVRSDPVLHPLAEVVTPTLSLVGIAGNFSPTGSAAKTFLGVGFVPSDRARMRQWDEYGASSASQEVNLDDGDPSTGFVGVGLGRILGLCGRLRIADCPPAPVSAPQRSAAGATPQDFSYLQEPGDAANDAHALLPRLDLLAATANGAPNVVSLYVKAASPQGVKELDDNVIGMHLALAQRLVYGRSEPKVTGLVIQLRRSEDLPLARTRLQALFAEHHLPLDVREFSELNPFYVQVKRFFGSIFLFIALIMGVIVLFTIVNTMTMAVLERTTEVGTTRALGVKRRGVQRQFLLEGGMLGALGATAGVAVASLATLAINHAHLTWTPPGNAQPVPFHIALFGQPTLIAATWIALTSVATLAAWLPANRAARLPIVDALRHV